MSEESLGARIKAERKKRGWSQGRLAEKLGVTDRTVLRWEIKDEMPNNENRLALIKILGLREENFQLKPKGQALEGATPSIEPTDLERMLPPKDDFKMYSGRRIYKRDKKGRLSRIAYVTVNGRPIKNFGTDTRNPEEQPVFEWGYWGEGPSTLAQAILADFFEETYPERGYASSKDYNAPLYERLFKKDFIGRLPSHVDDEMEDDSWQITSDQIRRWFATLEERGITRETLLKDLYGEDYYKRS
jgi:transcriptional regulator with XRE-family HTH domain